MGTSNVRIVQFVFPNLTVSIGTGQPQQNFLCSLILTLWVLAYDNNDTITKASLLDTCLSLVIRYHIHGDFSDV